VGYNRQAAVAYAHRWAFARNPLFYDFSDLGGDCTNFISQCLYAGGGVMNLNHNPALAWFYLRPNNRSASWTGVPFLYHFLIHNKGPGPWAIHAPLAQAEAGDVIQLFFNGEDYGHSLFVVEVAGPDPYNIYIATHTYDSDFRPLSSYGYAEARLLHIEGARF